MTQFLYIGLGAALGANARYLVSLWSTGRLGVAFPHGTWLVNVTGSFILGLLITLMTERLSLSPNVRFLMVVGFLGSYTTFSTYALETILLWRETGWWAGAGNLVLNNVLGLAAVLAGMWLARWLAIWLPAAE